MPGPNTERERYNISDHTVHEIAKAIYELEKTDLNEGKLSSIWLHFFAVVVDPIIPSLKMIHLSCNHLR